MLKIIRKDESGGTFMEFTISVLVTMTMLLLGAELLYVAHKALTVQYVAFDTLRVANLGPLDSHAEMMKKGFTFTQIVRKHAKDTAATYGLSLENEMVQICPIANPDCYPNINTGGQSDLISVKIDYSAPGFISGPRNVSGLAVGRNEAF